MTLLRRERDTSPSGLNLISDERPLTTESLKVRVQREVAVDGDWVTTGAIFTRLFTVYK